VNGRAASAWQDPASLEAMSRTATRVTLAWGQTTTQDLKVGNEVTR
jgi:hypothetical protein